MKFFRAFFDYFFGLGATIALMDVLLLDGAIEESMSLPEPLKIVMGIGIAFYWISRTVWFVISKTLEYKERTIEIIKKQRELLGESPQPGAGGG